MWSVLSIVVLLAGVGALTWYVAAKHYGERNTPHVVPGDDPLRALSPTPSMRATLKYFWVVAALIVAQVLFGVVTAHYGVEGNGFYGIPLAKWLPYSVARTWHTQLGIFWIATVWLATGFFIAPAVAGGEPSYQRLGVNFLFVCLLVSVVGSMAGAWLAVQQRLGFVANFWFGHQGYEYVDLGRFWQGFLLIGLALWLALMVLLSLLPIGLLQTWASVDHGLWYARSAEFLQTDVIQTLRWLRMVDDTVFAVGTLALGWFIPGLKSGWSLRTESLEIEPAASRVA